jgi:hypothetical protein
VNRYDASGKTLPIVAFARAQLRTRDRIAISLVSAVLCFSIFVLLLPVSRTVQAAAARRFQLAGWPFAAWAVFQPLPSMYNLENRWEVTFAPRTDASADEACRRAFSGFINHHIFNRILLQRVGLERCGLPAQVRFVTTYRGAAVETRYVLTRGPGLHGFVVSPRRE